MRQVTDIMVISEDREDWDRIAGIVVVDNLGACLALGRTESAFAGRSYPSGSSHFLCHGQ